MSASCAFRIWKFTMGLFIGLCLAAPIGLSPGMIGKAQAASSTPVHSVGYKRHGHRKGYSNHRYRKGHSSHRYRKGYRNHRYGYKSGRVEAPRLGYNHRYKKRHDYNKRHGYDKRHGYNKRHGYDHRRGSYKYGYRKDRYRDNNHRYRSAHNRRHGTRHGYHRRHAGHDLSGRVYRSHRAYRSHHRERAQDRYNQVETSNGYYGGSGAPYIDAIPPDAVLYDPPRETIINGDFNDAGTQIIIGAPVPPCPRNHNCGYRIYSDGSGPRVITPGVSSGNVGVQFDGIMGPTIITVDD